MSSSCTETALISDIVELNKFTIWQIVAISAALDEHIGSAILVRYKLSLLCPSNAVACQVVVGILTVIVTNRVLLQEWNLRNLPNLLDWR